MQEIGIAWNFKYGNPSGFIPSTLKQRLFHRLVMAVQQQEEALRRVFKQQSDPSDPSRLLPLG